MSIYNINFNENQIGQPHNFQNNNIGFMQGHQVQQIQPQQAGNAHQLFHLGFHPNLFPQVHHFHHHQAENQQEHA